MDNVRIDQFDIRPKRQALKDNKKDMEIVKLRSELHEVRQRQRDFADMTERYTSLKSRFEMLKEQKNHSYEQGLGDYRHQQRKGHDLKSELTEYRHQHSQQEHLLAEQRSRLLFEQNKEGEHLGFINQVRMQLAKLCDTKHQIMAQVKGETHNRDVKRDTTAQHSMHSIALATKMQQGTHELAHLETQKSALAADISRLRQDLEQMSAAVEKRTFDEVEVSKQITATDALAHQVRLKHQDALGLNIEVQKAVILTET